MRKKDSVNWKKTSPRPQRVRDNLRMRERLNKYKGYARKAMTAETRSVNERGDDTWQLHGRVLRRKSKNRRARRSNSGRSTAGGRNQRSSCQAPRSEERRVGKEGR